MRDISSPLDGFSSPFGPQRNRTLQSLLFGMNEPGFTFEPWDITTLYQDRAGTTPVTAAGQSVGLRLSKDQGLVLGPELVTFSDDPAAYAFSNAIGAAASGSLQVTKTGANGYVLGSMTTTAGKTYKVTVAVRKGTITENAFRLLSSSAIDSGFHNNPTPTNNAGTLTLYFSATSATSWVYVQHFGAEIGTFLVDNISVRELLGNHQVAISDAKRGVYGWMPKTGRRNLLTYTEQFDNAAWTKANGNVTMSGAVGTFIPTATSGLHYLGQAKDAGTASRTMTVEVKAAGYTKAVLVESINTASQSRVVDLTNGSFVGGFGGTTVVEPLADGWYRISWTSSGFSQSNSVWGVWPVPDSGVNTSTLIYNQAWTADGVSGIQIRYPHIDLVAGAYQRVASQYDITEAGVPTCYYVQADGVDDAYVTPTITPNTDKVQVFAGVRKLSDADAGCRIVELGADVGTVNGSFALVGPHTTGTFGIFARGTAVEGRFFTSAAPVTSVLTAALDIPNATLDSRINLRENGVSKTATFTGTGLGIGNFLAYPAYIYSRAGTSLPFNGLDFGHAVRFGPNLDAATIARVEALIARNTPEVTL